MTPIGKFLSQFELDHRRRISLNLILWSSKLDGATLPLFWGVLWSPPPLTIPERSKYLMKHLKSVNLLLNAFPRAEEVVKRTAGNFVSKIVIFNLVLNQLWLVFNRIVAWWLPSLCTYINMVFTSLCVQMSVPLFNMLQQTIAQPTFISANYFLNHLNLI